MSCGDPLTITGVGVGIKKEFVSLFDFVCLPTSRED